MTVGIAVVLLVLAFVVLTLSRLYKVFMEDTLADLWEFPDPDSDADAADAVASATSISADAEGSLGNDRQKQQKQQGETQQ